jgi:tetratricopeptide (TPR) repeat protein
MRAEDWPRFTELLDELLELEGPARSRRLDELAADEPVLHGDLLEWLASDAQAQGFLDAPIAPGATWERAPLGPRAVGETIGDFEILRWIGIGGTALVYEAAQREPRRSVALKVFQTELGSRARERFVEEARTLAALRHPGIAEVIAAGVDTSDPAERPWIAMELVHDARPMTVFAREEGYDRAARLALFVTVADAVAHGHERGVIHRDLKPANILVDAEGRPKVIDFGLARVVPQAPDDVMPALAVTGGLVGTLPWMSPERVAGEAPLPDTRADVYALGVILYELLCDALPHAGENESAERAVKRILDPAPVRLPSVDRDLEAIVQTAMARTPEARYATAAELAVDVRRWLAREPVVARRSGAWHALVLAAVRHRRAVMAASVGLLLVTAALALGLVRSARIEARERARADEVTQFLKSILAFAIPSSGSGADLTMLEVLDDASSRIEVELAEAPDARAEVHALVGSAWRELGQLERARTHLESAAAVYRRTRPGSTELAGALSILSEVLLAEGRGAEAEVVLREALALYEADPEAPAFFIGIVKNKLAGARRLQGDTETAEALASEALEIYREAFGPEHLAVASAHDNLALIRRDAGRMELALDSAREALRVHLASGAEDGLAVAQARARLASLLLESEADAEARIHLERAHAVLARLLPDGHPERVRVQELLLAATR